MKAKDALLRGWLILRHPCRWIHGKTLIQRSRFYGIKGNKLQLERTLVKKSALTLKGSDHQIKAQGSEIFQGDIFLRGKRHKLIIDEGVKLYNVRIKIIGTGNTVHIGAGTSFGSGNIICGGNGISIVIGEKCMMADGVELWSTDTHSVFQDGKLVNAPQSIIIGNHVWLGKDVAVLKGVTIGDNAVVGMRSLVTSNIRPGTLNVGSPSKEIRDNINWGRSNPNN